VVGPFFFVERTITADAYLDLLERFVLPQVDIERGNATGVVFQHVGALPHFDLQVCLALNAVFLNQWI
jgi:hypothetical protein